MADRTQFEILLNKSQCLFELLFFPPLILVHPISAHVSICQTEKCHHCVMSLALISVGVSFFLRFERLSTVQRPSTDQVNVQYNLQILNAVFIINCLVKY